MFIIETVYSRVSLTLASQHRATVSIPGDFM